MSRSLLASTKGGPTERTAAQGFARVDRPAELPATPAGGGGITAHTRKPGAYDRRGRKQSRRAQVRRVRAMRNRTSQTCCSTLLVGRTRRHANRNYQSPVTRCRYV